MPKKGLPRCKECGYSRWLPVSIRPGVSASIRCGECGTQVVTRSMRGIRQMIELEQTISNMQRPVAMFRTAAYRVVANESTPGMLVIRDVGDDMAQAVASVTNDAERVVRQLKAGGLLPEGRRLAYYDSEGDFSELLIANGEFSGFAPLERVSQCQSNQPPQASNL